MFPLPVQINSLEVSLSWHSYLKGLEDFRNFRDWKELGIGSKPWLTDRFAQQEICDLESISHSVTLHLWLYLGLHVMCMMDSQLVYWRIVKWDDQHHIMHIMLGQGYKTFWLGG